MKQYIITALFDDVLLLGFCFCLVSLHGDQCSKSSGEYNNGGLLPDIILLIQRYYHYDDKGATRLNAMKMFCHCSLL